MTISKWFGALVVLVIVIFGVTFLRNYLAMASKSDDASSTSDSPDLPTLTVPIRSYPYTARSGLAVGNYELEHRKPGHQDYWFVNQNDEKVRIGAISKSCKCQGVEVFIMPEGMQARPLISPPPPVIAAGIGLIGRRALEVYSEGRESTADLEAQKESFVTLNPDDPNAEADVPPHRAGWIRMKWTGERPGKLNLTVKLWMNHPGSGLDIDLERKADFVDPVRVVGNDRGLGTIPLQNLPRKAAFYVWSSTRRTFNITKVDAVRSAGLPASSDPFVIGEPITMTTDQCSRVEMVMNQGRVLFGYQIPVTLQKVAPDGKSPFDLGNFRRRVEIYTDAFDKPLFTTFSGIVQGDLHVSGVDESGGVTFSSFRHDSKPKRFVVIRTDDPGIKLELDKSRTPEYILPTLTQETSSDGPSNTWRLELTILPSAYGPFPRDDDPIYRDSAVYIHTVGPNPRTIRVSIKGDAADR